MSQSVRWVAFVLLGGWLCSGSAWAGPDIVPRLASQFSVRDGLLEFQLDLKNQGLAMERQRVMHSQVLLVPKKDYAKQLVAQGLVVGEIQTPLYLGQGDEVRIPVSLALPTVSNAEYFLAVTINTTYQWDVSDGSSGGDGGAEPPIDSGPNSRARPDFIDETIEDQKNNITEDMLFLGFIEHESTEKREGQYDLYHEVQGAAINLSGGLGSHTSRNILRVMDGNDVIPEPEFWNDDISARFCFFNIEKGKAFIGAYTEDRIDKVWGAIYWTPEVDMKRRPIYVDYYSNQPRLDHLEQGEYVLGVLLNVTGKFTLDSYPENNLDLTYFNLSGNSVMTVPKEVWVNVQQNPKSSISASINSRSDLHEWSFSVKNWPEWLIIQKNNTGYSFDLNVSTDSSMPVGSYKIPISIVAENEVGEITSSVVELNIFKFDGPIIEFANLQNNELIGLSDRRVKVVEVAGIKTLFLEIEVRNSGNRDLLFSPGTSYSPSISYDLEGSVTVAPGASHLFHLTYRLVNVPLPRQGRGGMAPIYINLNSNAYAAGLTVVFDLSELIEPSSRLP